MNDLQIAIVLKWAVLAGTLLFAAAWMLGEAIVRRWRHGPPRARRFYRVVTARRAQYISLFDPPYDRSDVR